MIFKHTVMVTLLVSAIGVLTAQTLPQQPSTATQVTPLLPEAAEPVTKEVPFKESWQTVSLQDSGLPLEPVDGVVLSKIDLPEGCTREVLRMQWRPVDPIDVYVIRPDDIEKPPIGLFLLNYTFDTAVFRSAYWCNQARQNHLAINGFGSALSVQRFHAPRTMKQWFVSELQESLATSTHDVQMILNYAQARKDLDGQHIGMYGQGSGGAIGILAAAVDSRITALQLVDPWGDWPDWLKNSKQIPEDERATYLKPEFLQKVANLDPVLYLPKLKERSLRIQQVLSDPVTPLEAKDKIAGAAQGTNEVIRYADNEAQHKAIFLGGITEWLAEQLHPVTITQTRKAGVPLSNPQESAEQNLADQRTTSESHRTDQQVRIP